MVIPSCSSMPRVAVKKRDHVKNAGVSVCVCVCVCWCWVRGAVAIEDGGGGARLNFNFALSGEAVGRGERATEADGTR
jgi:hypothetical protein